MMFADHCSVKQGGTVLLQHFLLLLVLALLFSFHLAPAQMVREYTVTRAATPIRVDGRLDEADWNAAALTDRFVLYADGAPTRLRTQAKFLWDDHFLYIGFICEDPDVWATMTKRDDHLWNGEVVEILCDPDGDSLNYFEVQVNPLGTVLDLFLAKPYYAGGIADLSWNLDSLKSGVWVDGTLNDSTDVDSQWTCEVALPFKEIAFMAPSLSFPPRSGDAWRILVTRYDYERVGLKRVEVSSWNQTDSRGFHVPSKFGRIVFADSVAVSVRRDESRRDIPRTLKLLQNYPNPFNPSTTIRYGFPSRSHVTLTVFNTLGQQVASLVDGDQEAGYHEVRFDGSGLASGVHFYRLTAGSYVQTRKLLLLR
jgi:hypothetical protein